jgi:Putative peptidoglycan binding domain
MTVAQSFEEWATAVADLYGFQYLPQSGIDGSFGPQTLAAVKAYQTANGLSRDGLVGPNTWHSLLSHLTFQRYECEVLCYYVYSSPSSLGKNRWAMDDNSVNSWEFIWNGQVGIYSTQPHLGM